MQLRNKAVTIFVIINVIVYILEYYIFLDSINYVIYFLTEDNYIYRILGYIFAGFSHLGFSHILFNMVFLYYFGPILENSLKSKTFVIYYLSVLITSAIVTDLLSEKVAIGASGAIYAIIGTVYSLNKKFMLTYHIPNKQIVLLIIISFLSTIITPGISLAGHFSGFVIGLIAAEVFYYLKKK